MKKPLSYSHRKLLSDWFNRTMEVVPDDELQKLLQNTAFQSPAFRAHFAGNQLWQRAQLESTRRALLAKPRLPMSPDFTAFLGRYSIPFNSKKYE